MVFSFTNAPKLTAADMGVPDYANALRKGFQTAADVYKPSSAAAGLLDAMLKNKHSQIINQYLPRSEEARIGHNEALGEATRSNTGLDDVRRRLMEAQALHAQRQSENVQSPYEKDLRTLNLKGAEERQTQNLKTEKELSDHAQKLLGTLNDVQGLQTSLFKPEGETGGLVGLKNLAGFGSTELGGMNEKITRLQADLARLISSRGGVGAANIAAAGKPNIWRGTEYNQGLTKAMAQRINREYKETNDEYKRITGKELPFKLPKKVMNPNEMVEVHDNHTNTTRKMKRSEAEKLMSEQGE